MKNLTFQNGVFILHLLKPNRSCTSFLMGKSRKKESKEACNNGVFVTTSDSRTSCTKSAKSVGVVARRPASVTSLASQYNLVTGRYTANVTSSETLAEVKSGLQVVQYGQCLYDSVLLYLTCPIHKKVALSSVDTKGQFLPFSPIKTGESWLTSVVNLIQRILGLEKKVTDRPMFSDPLVLDILRIQMPIYFEFITRVSYQVKLTHEACKAKLCNDNSMIAWFPIMELQTKIHNSDQFAGPEPVLFGTLEPNQNTREVTILDVLLFKIIEPGKSSVSTQGELLRTIGYTEADILKIYGDYLQFCCPSEFMTYHTFKAYLNQVELQLGPKLLPIFRSFSFNENPYINFYEFLLGLAMVDRMNGTNANEQCSTNSASESGTSIAAPINDGQWDEFAGKYVFRYFAKTDFNFLTDAEVNKVINYNKISNAKIPKSNNKSGRMTQKTFLKSVYPLITQSREKQICNTSIYASCTVSPLARLRTHQCFPPINWTRISRNQDRSCAIKTKMARARDLCSNCRLRQYTLSTFLVKMNCDGLIYEPLLNKQADVERMSRVRRILSERYFTRNYVCNQLVDMIRKYAIKLKIYSSKIKIDAPDWELPAQRLRCVDKIVNICSEAKAMFEKGGRVLKVGSPCYVIGDIHGNLNDLLIYEKVLWKLGPYFNAANFLFLGDYVDRGDYSVECILYLLCMKLLAPDRIHMLRGNHEARALQVEFTFQTEVNTKFAHEGARMFEVFNDVFDAMPLCALLDESIYTAHGGIV